MAESEKVVINLATGLEDAERVMIAFLVGHAATQKGKQVAMFMTKDAVHLAVPGKAQGVGVARVARRSSGCSSSTPTAVASCSSARSA